jgi:hypothetical protein
MPTLVKAPRNTWNSISLLRSWKLKVIKYFKNVKIRWISMLELIKRVMNEYCTLMVKMALDFVENIYAKANVKLLYGLAILLPLSMEMNYLMKLAQVQVGIFVFIFNILSNLWWVFPIALSSCIGYYRHSIFNL